ncbi:MAG TPA: hypothetical protein VLX92_00410 [Kofleriaceae bacterium]|nr:hypothetical protein [Kofleriaceae bacterium]
MHDVAVDQIVVRGDVVSHPLLGAAHVIEHAGRAITAISAIDWDCPATIPAIAAPGALPPGSGAALLNELARRAVAARIPALRYAGPYPTPALWRALARSFRTTGDEAAFTADVLGRALRLARDELPIDFAPAPHQRIAFARGFCERRDGIERAVIDGVAYEPGGSPARLVDQRAAELWFGDACYARIAELGDEGLPRGEPAAPPALDDAVIGQGFPPALRAALAELVGDVVVMPLADDARALVAASPIAWADLGARAARSRGDGFEIHGALWRCIAPLGMARLALAIAEALAPVVTGAIIARVQRASVAG